MIIQKKPSTLPCAVQAAMISVPNELMQVWMMILEMEYMLDCSPAGTPTRSTPASIPRVNRSRAGSNR